MLQKEKIRSTLRESSAQRSRDNAQSFESMYDNREQSGEWWMISDSEDSDAAMDKADAQSRRTRFRCSFPSQFVIFPSIPNSIYRFHTTSPIPLNPSAFHPTTVIAIKFLPLYSYHQPWRRTLSIYVLRSAMSVLQWPVMLAVVVE